MLDTRRFTDRDMARIFPICDAESARLMKIKARSLCAAGIVSARLKAKVYRAADAVILGREPARRRAPPADYGTAGSRHQVSGR
jgi:hypothetical protein